MSEQLHRRPAQEEGLVRGDEAHVMEEVCVYIGIYRYI
jgi:hypothetical protein